MQKKRLINVLAILMVAMFANGALFPVLAKPNEITITVKDWETRKAVPNAKIYIIPSSSELTIVETIDYPFITVGSNGKITIDNSGSKYIDGDWIVVYRHGLNSYCSADFTIRNLGARVTIYI
jgi:hypothetical protein